MFTFPLFTKVNAFKVFLNFSDASKHFYIRFFDYVTSKTTDFESLNFHKAILFPMKKSEFDSLINYLNDLILEDNTNLNLFNDFIKECKDQSYLNEAILNNSNLAPNEIRNITTKKKLEIESSVIALGVTSHINDDVSQYINLLETQIQKYKCPIYKLEPRFSPNYYEEMISLLIDKKFVDDTFFNKKTIYHWVQNAFYFEKDGVTRINENLHKLNWIAKNELLSDWLHLLKYELINYTKKDNSQLYDWIYMHVQFKGKPIIKKASTYNSIKKYLRDFQKEIKPHFFKNSAENKFIYEE
jgi:hypothetical protein